MGEAKRRQLLESKGEIEYRDASTGQLKTARNAGNLIEFIDQLAAMEEAVAKGEQPTSNVPCRGCTACCYHTRVDFDPTHEREDDLSHLNFVPAENGHVRLKKNADGSCTHLGADGCTVYGHRPRPCRQYDCRGAALVSMVDTFDDNRHSPVWIFESGSEAGRILKEGFRFLGITHQATAQRSGGDATIGATLRYAMQHINGWCAAMGELMKMSDDDRTKVLGFNPNNMTADDMMQAVKGMTAGLKVLE